jgi:RimJ/RimL family protein N-acetyltransferase
VRRLGASTGVARGNAGARATRAREDGPVDVVELTDGVVRLALPQHDEVGTIARLCSDPQVQRWTRVPSPYRPEDAEWFLEHVVAAGWASGLEPTWAVRDPSDGHLAGMIGLRRPTPGAAEIGYWMGAADRGRGWTTRALHLVATFAFDSLGLDHLVWAAQVGNWSSRRVAWRVGFRVEGTLRRWMDQRGAWFDSWLGTLLREDPRTPPSVWLTPVALAGALPDGTPLRLRRFTRDDAAAVAEACSDPVTRHWLGELPSPYTTDIALEYIESREDEHAKARGVHWAATLGDGGPAIGAFSLIGPGRSMLVGGRLGGGTAEIGYWVHPRARRRGVATTAVDLVVGHALAPLGAGGLGLRFVTLAHAVGNEASATVARRTGFVEWGRRPAAERLGDGSYADLVWLSRSSPAGARLG